MSFEMIDKIFVFRQQNRMVPQRKIPYVFVFSVTKFDVFEVLGMMSFRA